jgi:AcrR family transcriptional regulator
MLPIADPATERGRICATVLELIGEGGYGALSPFEVERRTGLTEQQIARHFGSLDECVAAIWEDFDAELGARLEYAFAVEGTWRRSMRGALGALFDLIAAEPEAARLYVVESAFAGDEAGQRRQEMIARLATLIDRAPPGNGGGPRPPMISEAIAGGIWQHVHQQIRAGGGGRLREDLPQLMYFTVLPFLGSAAAEAELRKTGGAQG